MGIYARLGLIESMDMIFTFYKTSVIVTAKTPEPSYSIEKLYLIGIIVF